MEILWSPWRSEYIKTFKDKKENEEPECFLCSAANDPFEMDESNLIIYRGEACYMILNKFPYNNGHLLITPYRHTGNLFSLGEDEYSELGMLVKKAVKIIESAYKPHGFNIGINLGQAAGAGLPGHLHYHVIPRWNGDTSFTATASGTKVISVSLEETYDQLKA
ncbi:MAG: HIT family protein, partial [Bacteroidota bacterium]